MHAINGIWLDWARRAQCNALQKLNDWCVGEVLSNTIPIPKIIKTTNQCKIHTNDMQSIKMDLIKTFERSMVRKKNENEGWLNTKT